MYLERNPGGFSQSQPRGGYCHEYIYDIMVSWYHNSNDTVKPFFNFIEVTGYYGIISRK